MIERHSVFNGQRIVSPGTVVMAVFALLFIAALPPLGLILAAAAILNHRRFRGHFKAADRQREAVLAERRRRERILAFKSLP